MADAGIHKACVHTVKFYKFASVHRCTQFRLLLNNHIRFLYFCLYPVCLLFENCVAFVLYALQFLFIFFYVRFALYVVLDFGT